MTDWFEEFFLIAVTQYQLHFLREVSFGSSFAFNIVFDDGSIHHSTLVMLRGTILKLSRKEIQSFFPNFDIGIYVRVEFQVCLKKES